MEQKQDGPFHKKPCSKSFNDKNTAQESENCSLDGTGEDWFGAGELGGCIT